jgi:hypothetical protein
MALAPLPDAGDLVGASEVIAVPIFAEPPLLAGGLARLPAAWFGTVALAILSPSIRKEEPIATTAFTSSRRAAHYVPPFADATHRKKIKRSSSGRRNPKKEEEL